MSRDVNRGFPRQLASVTATAGRSRPVIAFKPRAVEECAATRCSADLALTRDVRAGDLLDDVIRPQQQRRRDGEAERLGGLQVKD